jgi:hypothetical protein
MRKLRKMLLYFRNGRSRGWILTPACVDEAPDEVRHRYAWAVLAFHSGWPDALYDFEHYSGLANIVEGHL